jgi:hypothetical protein
MISTRRPVLAAEYQEKTRMWIFRGPVGMVSMWSSTLSPLIFGRVQSHVIVCFGCVRAMLLFIMMIWYHQHYYVGKIWYCPRLYDGMMWYHPRLWDGTIWYLLAFLSITLTKLSSLPWCQKCFVGKLWMPLINSKKIILKLSIRKRIDKLPLQHFTREYTEYRYLYLIHKEELWGWVDIEILTNMYTYDPNHSYALAGVSQVINKW